MFSWTFILIVVLCALQIISWTNFKVEAVTQPIVRTRFGTLRGERKYLPYRQNTYVDIFRGVPYARPPLGNLRFARPQPPSQWSGIRDATTFKEVCMQMVFGGWGNATGNVTKPPPMSEDCLYLNIYTPQASSPGALPVMFFIQGGGPLGTGNMYNGTELASFGQVVVVTINFRLDALGLLSTEDAASVGNYGIWDQIQALKFIKEVIPQFNGNPNDITVFGESSGSVGTAMLILTPVTKGLFSRAIMETGTSMTYYAATTPWENPSARDRAIDLAKSLGCITTNSYAMVQCLRGKSAKDIIQHSADLIENGNLQVSYRAVVEPLFGETGLFPALPRDLYQYNSMVFNNVTTIRGCNNREGGAAAYLYDPEKDGMTAAEFQNSTDDLLKRNLNDLTDSNRAKAVQIVMTKIFAPKNLHTPEEIRNFFLDFATSLFATAYVVEELKLASSHADLAPAYFYYLDHRSANRNNEVWQGVEHADDLPFVFGEPVSNTMSLIPNFATSWTQNDVQVSKDIMTMWTNFARYGDPTYTPISGQYWTPWSNAHPSYFLINTQSKNVPGYPDPDLDIIINEIFPLQREAGHPNNLIG